MSTLDDIIPLNAPARLEPPWFPGDPAPWFFLRSDVNEKFSLSSMGGRTILITFLESLSNAEDAAVRDGLLECVPRLIPYANAMLIVTADAADPAVRMPEGATGARYLFDPERKAATLYGALAGGKIRPTSFVVDARLRFKAVMPVRNPATHARDAFEVFARQHAQAPAQRAVHAPTLTIPDVFEPELCRRLIDGHSAHGGIDSGFMVERNGKTVKKRDPSHKIRRDWFMNDAELIDACRERIRRRIVPEIRRAFQFEATRIERYLVACYDSDEKGHFAAHRDNTTKGTAHRRFAVSLNLNDDYVGGNLVFPEFGQHRFRPPPGGACVFSCSLMHLATPVTDGKRYVFVPFLHDDAGECVRQANQEYLSLDD
ncbi:MAG: 2OG-Fe(II) oxygenase [Terricaulis sp.]